VEIKNFIYTTIMLPKFFDKVKKFSRLEEKTGARKIRKSEENFFAGQRAKRAAAGQSVSPFAQKRFAHFQTKGTKLDFLIFWKPKR